MRKEIKAYGNTKVIVLTKTDLKVYGLAVGDILELTITEINPKLFEKKVGKKK